ncbi:MAG TPA: AAA family ATPase [Acidimicrobiia bacterium]|nr:AAA family ATPase [Acidimicrobiia bacterium]
MIEQRRAIMTMGTGPGSGKTVVAAGLCRFLSNAGVQVAPFKAITVLPSGVRHSGSPRGNHPVAHLCRAARVHFHWRVSPVVLEPDGDGRGRLHIAGRRAGTAALAGRDAVRIGDLDAAQHRATVEAIVEAHAWLADRYEALVIEGAGSPLDVPPAEDMANIGVARLCSPAIVLVGRSSRGGATAGLVGTAACLPPDVHRLVLGFVLSDVTRPDLAIHAADLVERVARTPYLGSIPSLGSPKPGPLSEQDFEWQYEALGQAIADGVRIPELRRLAAAGTGTGGELR